MADREELLAQAQAMTAADRRSAKERLLKEVHAIDIAFHLESEAKRKASNAPETEWFPSDRDLCVEGYDKGAQLLVCDGGGTVQLGIVQGGASDNNATESIYTVDVEPASLWPESVDGLIDWLQRWLKALEE